MSRTAARRRVSRDDWLKLGLELLREFGLDAVKIDRMSRSLGVAKTGFYWHFRDRDELLCAMLEYWEREYTNVIADDASILALPPAERLLAISEAIAEYNLAEFDPVIVVWARQDERAASALKKTYATRSRTVRKAFRELGFDGEEVEMRTRLFLCNAANEATMYGRQTGSKARRLRERRLRLLTNPM
jgi:AcrR family transcriptional regulator